MAVHRIASLDQLDDPQTGDLYLFSLRVVRDQLAANTLPLLVDQIATQLAGSSARRDFDQKLSRRGYSPAHRRRYEVCYRIDEERLYELRGDFPRLTPATFDPALPHGIGNVTYTVDTAACAAWLAATTPDSWRRPRPV